jgi:hypothetical protein
MTNTNIDHPSSETPLTQNRCIQDSGQQKSEFHNSKSMFEGYFKFNNVFLHINTNNRQLFINTLIAAVRYLNQFR